MGSLNRTTFGNNSSLPSLTGSGDTGSKAFASPTWDAQLCWPKRFMLWVLRQGVIPRHFAIVPDGNRRFAKTNGLKLSHAYSIMLRKLTLICHCMAALGVAEVTAYLLSLRNFSRNTTDIVTALQESAKFFMQTLHSLSILRRISLRASVVGNMNLLPQDMQRNIAHVDIATDHGSRTTTLRLCIPYSSKLDLNNMVLDLANAVRVGIIKPYDISPGLIADWLELIETPETELWFRSSGERRFSEFLVLQSGYSYMHIEPELWPAMTIWNWVSAILRFQLYWPHIEEVKDKHRTLCAHHDDQSDPAKTIRQRSFLNHVKSTRMAHMNRLCTVQPTPPINISL